MVLTGPFLFENCSLTTIVEYDSNFSKKNFTLGIYNAKNSFFGESFD